MAKTENKNRDLKIAILLFTFFFLLYSISAGGHFYSVDSIQVFLTTQSIVERHEFNIRTTFFLNHDFYPIRAQDGSAYTYYGLGQTVALIPFYAGTKLLWPALELADYESFYKFWLVDLTFNPLVTSLTCIVLFYFARKLDYDLRISTGLAFLFGMFTQAWPYAKTMFDIPLAILLLLLAFYFSYGKKEPTLKSFALSGFFFGLSVLTRNDYAIFVFPLFIYIIAGKRKGPVRAIAERVFSFLLPASILVGIALLFNYARAGLLLMTQHPDLSFVKFDVPLLIGLYNVLFSSGAGLFIFSPIFVLMFVSFYDFYKKKPDIALVFGILTVMGVVLYASFANWHGWGAWGNRYLSVIGPFFVLSLGASLEARAKNRYFLAILCVLMIGSLASNLLGVVVNTVTAFTYRDGIMSLAQPGEFVPAKALYQPKYSPLAFHYNMLMTFLAGGDLPPGSGSILDMLAVKYSLGAFGSGTTMILIFGFLCVLLTITYFIHKEVRGG